MIAKRHAGRKLLVAIALVSGAALIKSQCGRASASEVVVRVDADMTFDELRDRVHQEVGPKCIFEWGNLSAVPRARSGALLLPDGRLDGQFICEDIEERFDDPRIKNLFFVVHRDGHLWASHPSGPGRSRIEIPDQPDDPVRPVLGFVLPHDSDVGPAIVLSASRHLPRIALYAMVTFE